MRVEKEVTINRVPDRVFEFTAVEHVRNHPRWDPAVTSITLTTPGVLGPGSHLEIIRRRGRRLERHDFEVAEWNPPSAFAIEARSPGLRLRLSERCAPEGMGRTRLTLMGDAQLGGVRGLVAPLLRGRLERDLQANLHRIKALMEAEPPSGA